MTNKDSVMQLTVYIVHNTVTDQYLSRKGKYSHWDTVDTCQIYHRESEAKSMCTRIKNEYERSEHWVVSHHMSYPADQRAREQYKDMILRKTLPNYGYAVVRMLLTLA